MKNRNVYIISAVLILGSLTATIYLISKSKNKNKSSNKSVKKINSILFVGDSNTFANFSYADQLKKMYPNLIIKKIAQNGANTEWMNQQLNTELQNNKYDVVSILGGSNDIYGGQTLDFSKRNLDAMYNLAHSKGSKVLAVTPPNKDFYENRTDAKQKQLDDLIAWIRNNKNKDYFIDFKNMTNDKSFYTSADLYLHPQAPAHKLLADKTRQLLNIS